MNMCSGTASVCGCRSATIIAVHHNSISNNADGCPCAVRYSVALLVMAFIWVVRGAFREAPVNTWPPVMQGTASTVRSAVHGRLF